MTVTGAFVNLAVTVQGDVGAKTVTVAVPLTDPDVAVIISVPSAIEVTKPADETVTIPELDVAHVTVAPEIVVPPASFTVGVSVAVASVDISESGLGDTSNVVAT